MVMDPHKKIDEMIAERQKQTPTGNTDKPKKPETLLKDLEKVKDNLKFYNTIQEAPVLTDKYDKKIFNYKVLNFNHYIKQQAWPESIFNIDKLIRLNVSAKYEWLKRYMQKKRTIGLDVFWVFLIFIIIGGAILAAWILLPNFL